MSTWIQFHLMKPVHINGVKYVSLIAAARAHNTNYHTFIGRLRRQGWDVVRAASEPAQSAPLLELGDRKKSVVEWARLYKVSVASTYKRLQRGDDLKTALTAPRRALRLTPAERAEARRVRDAERRKEIKAKLAAYKARPCKDCGLRFHPDAMEFDHCRGRKSFSLSNPPANLRRVAAEIVKCDLVCSNCHRVRTAARRKNSLS